MLAVWVIPAVAADVESDIQKLIVVSPAEILCVETLELKVDPVKVNVLVLPEVDKEQVKLPAATQYVL